MRPTLRPTSLLVVSLTAALAGALQAQAPAAGADLRIVRGDRVLLDPASGHVGPATLVIRDGRIDAVLPGADATVAAKPGDRNLEEFRFSGTDATLLPGLVDSHVHLTGNPAPSFWSATVTTPERATATGVANALSTVRAGFTTVRDLGAPDGAGYAVRDAINAGEVPGPRVLSAGRMISIIGGHGDLTGFRPQVIEALDGGNTCTGPVQCAERVREMSRAGADVIKLAATGGVLSQQNRGLDQHFSAAELASIVDTAHLLGLKVAAHAHGPRGIEAAARAGVDSIDHGTYIDAAGVAAMRASGTFLVPTLSPTIAYRERIGSGAYTAIVEAKIRQRLAATGKNIAAAREAGIRIAFGTDAGVSDHGRNAEEFPLMVRYGGMQPRDALAAATVEAADLLGLASEVGTLEAGKSADVIAVEGDPLGDVAALQQVRFVLARGRVARQD